MPEGDDSREGRVVYSRAEAEGDEARADGGGAGRGAEARAAEVAGLRESPWRALVPLLVGFALLVALVIGLGFLASEQVEDMRFNTQDEERRLAAKLNLLLNLNLALNKLNTEARIRGRLEAAGVMLPPTDLRLRNERRAVEEQLPEFDRLPVEPPERKAAIRGRIEEYIRITEDLRRYNLEGFAAYSRVEKDLETLFDGIDDERVRIDERRDAALAETQRKIEILMWLGAVTGLVVATATFLEVWRRFRQMLEGMPSAVAALDHDDRIRSANAAFFELFPGARLGASIHDKFTGPEGLSLLAAATGTHVERATYGGRFRLPGGGEHAERSFDVYSSPLAFDGEDGQLLTLVDVTEAAESEQELRRQEALAAVGQAAAQVAHEIKNPLGSIRLGVAMLRDMTKDKEAINTIDLIERGIEHLSKLTLDVTQFSRRRRLTLEEVELSDLLAESLDLVSDKLREKRTPVERHFAGEAVRGHWDEDLLRQVFVNLLANAVDASPEGSPVSVTTATAVVGGGHPRGNGEGEKQVAGARVQIADRGTGMDERTRARIFEPFFTTKKKGTGLGLAIAKQIVEQHGGRISVESRPGEGTCFTIELPLAPSGD